MVDLTDIPALRRLLKESLRPLSEARIDRLEAVEAGRSDFDLTPGMRPGAARALKPAGVLVPIVQRASGLTVLLTQRAAHLPAHAGQVSFPGGRVQAEDADAVATALRETEEEIGLTHDFIEPLGLLHPYETGTGFSITPVVSLVRDGFTVRIDPGEVADVFETPLAFLMDKANHERHSREWQGTMRTYYAMPHQGRYIWGATAGMLVDLAERLGLP